MAYASDIAGVSEPVETHNRMQSARLAELVHDNTQGRREDSPLLRVSRLCDHQTDNKSIIVWNLNNRMPHR